MTVFFNLVNTEEQSDENLLLLPVMFEVFDVMETLSRKIIMSMDTMPPPTEGL